MRIHASISLVVALGLVACGSHEESSASPSTPATTPVAQPTPPPAPPAVEPLPTTEANLATLSMPKILLGRSLYHDTRLSGDGTLSCASCHNVGAGGAEPRAVSTGIRGQQGPINAPTVLNSGLNFVQFWDGRAATLEEQAAGPVANPIEMGANWETVVATLRASETDVAAFAAVYPDGITQTNITDAIAEYERSLQTPSRFDAFLRGDRTRLNEQEQRGWATFQEVGCTTCHRGANVGGGMYQRMGLVRNYFEQRGTPLTEADNGRFNVTHQESDRHFFKVPTLRNIAQTAPYFHDGSQTDLGAAVRIMGSVQLGRDLTDAQVADIVAFLGSLTGELPPHALLPTQGVLTAPTVAPSAPGSANLGALLEGVVATPPATEPPAARDPNAPGFHVATPPTPSH